MASFSQEQIEELADNGWLGGRGRRTPPRPSGDMYTGIPTKRRGGGGLPPTPSELRMTAEESGKFLTRARRVALVGELEKKLPMAVAKRIGGGALKAVPLVGAALTAGWLADEAWDATVGKDQEGKIQDAEFGLSLGTDNEWMQSAQDKSLNELMRAGADVGESFERFGVKDQVRRENEVRQSMAPWRAEMASQAYLTQPSLPEMLAKMGIDPYMEERV